MSVAARQVSHDKGTQESCIGACMSGNFEVITAFGTVTCVLLGRPVCFGVVRLDLRCQLGDPFFLGKPEEALNMRCLVSPVLVLPDEVFDVSKLKR